MPKVSTTTLQVPEIVYNIVQFMKKGDLARIVTVSKGFHRSTVPLIWETVYGAAPLFRLLPCTESNNYIRISTRYYGTFTFSKPLAQADLSRLGFYATFVKHLNLLSRTKDLKTVVGWEVLFDHVRAGHILLPNLVTLELKPPGGAYHQICPYLWAFVFCSPSLRSISIDGRLAEITPRVGSALLGLLVNTCPNLVELEFQLVEGGSKPEQTEYIPHEMSTGDHIPRFLQSVTLRLRNLVVNSFFANRYLLEISQCTCLECLEIRDYRLNEVAPISLPAGSFPALRELKFQNLSILEVEPFWRMHELTARLTTLECIFYPTDEEEDEGFNFPLRFSTTLCSISPYITDLTLNFDSEQSRIGDPVIFLETDVLQTLAQLPLRKLSLDGARISYWTNGSPSACKAITSIFPLLKVLRWPSEVVEYKDLLTFTAMPNLRHLAIGLDMELPSRDAFDFLSDIRRDRPLRVLEVELSIYPGRGDWYRVACYLSSIWPDIQLIPQSRGQTWRDNDGLRLSDNQYRMLNKFILLRRRLGEEQAADHWLSISEEWSAARSPEQPRGR